MTAAAVDDAGTAFVDGVAATRGGGGGGGPGVAAAVRAAAAARAGDPNAPGPGGRRPLRFWHAADAYAFGVVLWGCLTLRRPWAGLAAKPMWRRVARGERPAVGAAEAAAAREGYVALLRELWAQDPAERPAFAETLARLRGMTVR